MEKSLDGPIEFSMNLSILFLWHCEQCWVIVNEIRLAQISRNSARMKYSNNKSSTNQLRGWFENTIWVFENIDYFFWYDFDFRFLDYRYSICEYVDS